MAGPGLSRWAVPTAIAVVVVAGLVLRFWTRSDLWLDEALTVNVARLPLRRLSAGLRHDGAPPLYYLLLHAWMRVFGTGDVAVRSLSALFGIAALPVAWVAGRDLAGRRAGWIALVLLASSPYAIRYSTETRMYTLVMLLVLLGWVAVWRSLERPTPARLGAVALVSGMLLLTHYWSLYLLAVLEAALVWRWRREPKASNAGRVALAVVGGGVLLLPWLPDMVFQLRHTGTPWAQPATFRALVNAVSEFGGGIQDEGRGLGDRFPRPGARVAAGPE